MQNPPVITPGNLDILRLMFEKVLSDFSTIEVDRSDIKQSTLANLQAGLNALHTSISIYNDGKGYNDSPPPYSGRDYNQPGWQNMISYQLHAFNRKGSSYITCLSEGLIKTLGLIQAFQGGGPPKYALFRGQPDSKDEVSCSIGRKMSDDAECPEDSVSEFEIHALRKFQNSLNDDDTLRDHLFPTSEIWDTDDGRWWALKQHYDDDEHSGGTRLIDVSTSPLCGLYFACINWNGTVDEDDGALWVFTIPPGRRFVDADSAEALKAFDQDFDDIAGTTVYDYFRLDKHPQVIKCVLGFDHNLRSIAQDGLFLFNNAPKNVVREWWGQRPFCFIVPGQFKLDIARELYRVGYTPRKVVRGPKGELAQKNLESQLGF